jgi:hypothetical protein
MKIMKTKLMSAAILGGCLLLGAPAQARLGWSLKDCQQRYGQDTLTKNRAYPEIHVFHTNDIEIHIVFRNHTATLVTYLKTIAKKGFDQDEIDSILDKNADGAEWGSPQAFTEEGTKYTLSFATKRGERVERAEYDQTGDNAGILTIQTKAEYYFGKQLKNIDGV